MDGILFHNKQMYVFDVDSIKYGGNDNPSQVIIFANISQTPNTIFNDNAKRRSEYLRLLQDDLFALEKSTVNPFVTD